MRDTTGSTERGRFSVGGDASEMTPDSRSGSIPKAIAELEANANEERVSRVFQALSNPTRRAILRQLADGPKSVSEVVEQFSLSQPTISRHLTILSEADLVFRRRRGQHVLYRLNSKLMIEVGSIPMRVPRDRRTGRSVAPW